MKLLPAALLACAATFGAPAAAGPPDAESVRKAASAFDEGSRAYRANQYELAASHFEAADAAVPSARALRMAMRARTEAGQPGRASTLAELALLRYPNDADTRALAKNTVKTNASSLHQLRISCGTPCVLALGTRSVPGSAAKRWTVWVPPGESTISASFANGAGSDQQIIDARAGGKNTLSFLPKAAAPSPDGVTDPVYSDPGPAPPPVKPSTPAPGPDSGDDAMWIEHPAVFVVSLLLTAGAGGTLIWSGIDTLQNPGTDAVRDGCAGLGASCPAYQQGLDSQLRTNVLIGVTGGLGLVTGIIGIFVTDWGGDDSTPDTAFVVTPQGASMTYRGVFQ